MNSSPLTKLDQILTGCEIAGPTSEVEILDAETTLGVRLTPLVRPLMQNGRNPIRRSRNIGTKRQGHGSNNKMEIVFSRHDFLVFYEKLSPFIKIVRQFNKKEITFIVEPPKPGQHYPCTIEDVCHILQSCPNEDISKIDFIIFRHPKKKERILSSVWGRAIFYYTLGADTGTAIILEAQSLQPIIWDNFLKPDRAAELEWLTADGHHVEKIRNQIIITPTTSSLRNTLLYRTLLHEIGHHVDYHRSQDTWDSKPRLEKEMYAHKYASTLYKFLADRGVAPLPVIAPQSDSLLSGIKPEWFFL